MKTQNELKEAIQNDPHGKVVSMLPDHRIELAYINGDSPVICHRYGVFFKQCKWILLADGHRYEDYGNVFDGLKNPLTLIGWNDSAVGVPIRRADGSYFHIFMENESPIEQLDFLMYLHTKSGILLVKTDMDGKFKICLREKKVSAAILQEAFIKSLREMASDSIADFVDNFFNPKKDNENNQER